MNQVVLLVMAIAKRFEGFRSRPYLCPAGVATIGFGSTRYEDGTRVTLLDAPISMERGESLLRLTIERDYLPAVMLLCSGIDSNGRMAAITDFAYNLGSNALKNSTLRRRINAGDWESVPCELRKWTRGGGKVLKGLIARREAEIGLLS